MEVLDGSCYDIRLRYRSSVAFTPSHGESVASHPDVSPIHRIKVIPRATHSGPKIV